VTYSELKKSCLNIANLHPESQLSIVDIISLLLDRKNEALLFAAPLLLEHLALFADEHKGV
jgi:hypothetical protein